MNQYELFSSQGDKLKPPGVTSGQSGGAAEMSTAEQHPLGQLVSRVVIFSGLALFYSLLVEKSYLGEFEVQLEALSALAPIPYFFDLFVLIYASLIFVVTSSLPSRYFRRIEGFANLRIWAAPRVAGLRLAAIAVYVLAAIAPVVAVKGWPPAISFDIFKNLSVVSLFILISMVPTLGMMRYYQLRKQPVTQASRLDLDEMTYLGMHFGLAFTVLFLITTYGLAVPIYYGAAKAHYDVARLNRGDWGRIEELIAKEPLKLKDAPDFDVEDSSYIYSYVPDKQDMRLLFSDSHAYYILTFFKDGPVRAWTFSIVRKDSIIMLRLRERQGFVN